MVFNLNRILVGLILLISVLISYTYQFDFFLFFIVSFLILLELYYSKLLISYYFFILSLFFFLLSTLIYFYNQLFIFIVICLFLSSILSLKKNWLKILFPISIIFFNICFFYVLLNDRNLFYLIIFISFFNDSTAYLFGNLLKGPLIVPKISPKKTWSGTISSMFLSFIILLYFDFSYILSFILASSLFFGDLYFSLAKRTIGIKDFSKILGSHGGILDRLDSMFIFTFFISLNLLNI